MNEMIQRTIRFFAGLMILSLLVAPAPSLGVLLSKNYIIRQDRGVDILCDPYVVQKNDWLTKLFRQRGEIAEKDFPEFYKIFQRLNPHISDVNVVAPGQHIYIPLKRLEKDTLVGQDTGIVTIPFVTVTNLHEFIKNYSSEYTVRKGDWVSRLVTRGYGNAKTKTYNEGIELFKLLNPQVTNLDRIYPGQVLLLPDQSLRNKLWYASLFDSSGRISNVSSIPDPEFRPPTIEAEKKENKPPVKKLADILKGELRDNGIYHFPRKGAEDLKFDLSRTPVLELENGRRIVFAKDDFQSEDLNLIETYWRDTKWVTFNSESSLSNILDATINAAEQKSQKKITLSDNGLKIDVHAKWIISRPSKDDDTMRYICVNEIDSPEERTPSTISGYLEKKGIVVQDILQKNQDNTNPSKKIEAPRATEDVIPIGLTNHRTFVRHVLVALGVRYTENVKITFPYVGIQVEASANLISNGERPNLIVDFEDLYGDAIRAIERTGIKVIQVNKGDTVESIIEKLLNSMGRTYTRDPVFWTSKRPETYNTSLTVPGFLLENGGSPDTFLITIQLHDDVVNFLGKKGINLIMVQSKIANLSLSRK